MSTPEELEWDADYQRQQEEWEAHARAENAAGRCEFSGYEFKQCALGVCDCGFAFVPDEQLDAAIAKVVDQAKRAPA